MNKILKPIKIELEKAIHYPFFWIFVGITAFFITTFVIGSAYINPARLANQLDNQFDNLATNIITENLDIFPSFFNTTTWIASWFNMFLAVLVMQFITMEYNYRTFKQHIIDGLNSNNIVTGKLLFIIMLSIIFSVFLFIISAILNLIFKTQDQIFFNGLGFCFAYFLQLLETLIFATLISFLSKNLVVAILFYFGYIIFEKIISSLIEISFEYQITTHFPYETISNIIKSPSVNNTIINQNLFIGLIYTAIFVFLTYKIAQKQRK